MTAFERIGFGLLGAFAVAIGSVCLDCMTPPTAFNEWVAWTFIGWLMVCGAGFCVIAAKAK